MSHQKIFEIKTRSTLTETDIKHEENLKAEIDRFEKIGLTAQAAWLRMNELVGAQRGGLIVTPPLSPEENTIWREWLKVSWSTLDKDVLSECHFDAMPDEVIQHWGNCKDRQLFKDYEVRNGVCKDDYILIGINGTVKHLLARWSEQNSPLMAFDEIKRELRRSWPSEHRFFFLQNEVVAFVIGFCAFVLTGFGAGFFLDGKPWLIFVMMLTVGVAIFFFVRRKIDKQEWIKSGIGRAVAKHDTAQNRNSVTS